MYPAIAGLADMITMVANTAFTYIPVLVAWSAVKRFGGSPMLGVLLGLVLINGDLIPGSQMSSVISERIEPQYWNIFGIDILKLVIRILSCRRSLQHGFWLSWKMAEKTSAEFCSADFRCSDRYFVTSFLTFLFIGPAMNQVATWITDAIVLPLIKYRFLRDSSWDLWGTAGCHRNAPCVYRIKSQLVADPAKLYAFYYHDYLCIRSRSRSCNVKTYEE